MDETFWKQLLSLSSLIHIHNHRVGVHARFVLKNCLLDGLEAIVFLSDSEN